MAGDKILRCDSGYRLRARTEQQQEEALAVLLRAELEEGVPAGPARLEDKTRRKEQR